MRVAIVTTNVAGLLMLAGWAAGASAPLPPKCSPADTQRLAFLFSGGRGTDDEPGYMRYCGAGRVVMRVEGKSFTIQGGSCSTRRARFGLLWNRIGEAPVGRGFWVLLEPGNRPGRIDITDGEIQLPGILSVAAPTIGTAIVAKGVMSATTLSVGGVTKVTGRWTCGLRK
jgi:hypothetical protein